jgi:hypothetical protein
VYDEAGTKLIKDNAYDLPESRITDLDANGTHLYTLIYHPGHGVQEYIDFVAASFGPDYTHAAEMRCNQHHQA